VTFRQHHIKKARVAVELPPDAGDGCAANHFQPGLLLVAELAAIADTEAGNPGICNRPKAEKVRWRSSLSLLR
jgi:hypothetical protein